MKGRLPHGGRSFFAPAMLCFLGAKEREVAARVRTLRRRSGLAGKAQEGTAATRDRERREAWETWSVGRRGGRRGGGARSGRSSESRSTRDVAALTAHLDTRAFRLAAGGRRSRGRRRIPSAGVSRVRFPPPPQFRHKKSSAFPEESGGKRRKAEEKALRARRRYTMPCSPGRS